MAWLVKSAAGNFGRHRPGTKSVWMDPASAIQPIGLAWVWPGYVAREKFHVLAGPAGTGKTTLAVAMAATISRGGQWPDKTFARTGNIVIWSGEDGVEDTLVPRLLASGADMSRIHIVRGTFEATGKASPFSFAKDLPLLSEAMDRIGNVDLIIIDPIIQAVSGDANKNADVRRGLAPLLDVAEAHGAAVLGITHVNKGSAKKEPIDRVNGSLAFAALARVVLMTAKGRPLVDDAGNTISRAVLVRAKSNISADDGGFEYRIHPALVSDGTGQIATTALSWGPHIKGSAKEILAMASEPTELEGAVGDAAAFLQDLLASGGPMTVPDIETRAKEAGISPSALKRAKKELRIRSEKASGQGQFSPHVWSLPTESNSDCSGRGAPMSSNFPFISTPPMSAWERLPKARTTMSFASHGISNGQIASIEPAEPVEPVESVGSVVNAHATSWLTQIDPQQLQRLGEECRRRYGARMQELDSMADDEEGDEVELVDEIISAVVRDKLYVHPLADVYRAELAKSAWWV